MRLARKLTLGLVAGVLAVMAAYAWVQIGHEVLIINADLSKNEKLGHGLAAAIESIWAKEGEARAREMLDTIDRHGPDVIQLRWHRLRDLLANPPEDVSNEELAALKQRNIVTFRPTTNGEWVRHIYVPLGVPGEEPAVLEGRESLQEEHRYIDMNHRELAFASALVAIMCGLTAMGLGYWLVGRPLARLRDHARAIGAGELEGRVEVRQHDEIGDLAEELNRMSANLAEARARLVAETEARIATLDQLRHTDRLTTVGRLAAGVAHELGTPLNVVAGRAAKIATTETGQTAEYARIIQEQAARMTAIIRQLLDFSRRHGPKLAVCNVRTLVGRTVDLLRPFAERHGATIEAESRGGEPFARVDQNQLQQAITNIMMNGMQAMPRGGRLRIEIDSCMARQPDDEHLVAQPYLRIAIQDQGEGIPSQHLAYIFEPFFTTKGVGAGTGLGLSVAHGIITDHGGWIDVHSEVGKGTRMTIYLAAAEPSTAEAAS
jgi:two-component system, NtrC family, sensor kinase